MAIRRRATVPAAALALLGSLVLFPLRGKCQAPAPTAEETQQFCDQTHKFLTGDGDKPGLLQQANELNEKSASLAQDLKAEEVFLQGMAVTVQHLQLGIFPNHNNDGEKNIDPGPYLKNSYQMLIAILQTMKGTQDEIKKVRDDQAKVASTVSLLNTLLSVACPVAKPMASASPPLNTTVSTLPEFVTNTTLGSPVMPPATAPPTPKNPPATDTLAGMWTLTTSGGCEYQGGFKPGVTHKPDGSMDLESSSSGKISKVTGAQIDSVVQSWTLTGANVTLIVHPTSFFDDPATNPPKDKFSGGWASALTLQGTMSQDGETVSGSVFHNSTTPDCMFRMSR